MQQDIEVDGEICKVHAVPEGKAWKAYGVFRGHHVNAKGRTSSAALNLWKKLANLHFDDEPLR